MPSHPHRRPPGRILARLGLLALAVTLFAGLSRTGTPVADAQAPPRPPLPAGPSIQPPVPQQLCASFAAVQPAFVRAHLLTQAGCPPLATGSIWGIHQNGWQVCFVNATNLPFYFVGGLFDNVATAPARIEPHTQDCSIRGTASWFGGPADMNITYRHPYGTVQQPRQANITAALNASEFNNIPVLDFGCRAFETYDNPPLLKCSVSRDGPIGDYPIIVKAEYR